MRHPGPGLGTAAGIPVSAPVYPYASVEAVLDAVREVVAEFLGLRLDQVCEQDDLRAHGADSIDRVEILMTLKSRLGVDVPLAAFATIPHLRALAESLYRYRGAGR